MLRGTHPNITADVQSQPFREKISVCLVSRGPIDEQILKTLEGFGEVIVGRGDNGVCGRYEAVRQAKHDIIYTQDDDCVVDTYSLLAGWDGNFVSNMKANRAAEYAGNVTLIGWGAIFRKELTGVLDKYTARWGTDDLFRCECDRIFTGLNTHRNVFVDVENLPNAGAADRLSSDPKHWDWLSQAKRRVKELGGV